MSSLNGFYSSGLNPSSTSLLLVSEKFWKKSGESTGFDEVEAEESQSCSSIFHLFVYLLISHMKFTPQTEKSALSYTYDKTRELGRDYRRQSRGQESLSTLLLLHVVPSTMQEIVNAQINVTGITNPYLDKTENLTYYWVCEPTTQNWEAYYLAKPSASWNLWYQCWEAPFDTDPNLKIQSSTVCTFSP